MASAALTWRTVTNWAPRPPTTSLSPPWQAAPTLPQAAAKPSGALSLVPAAPTFPPMHAPITTSNTGTTAHPSMHSLPAATSTTAATCSTPAFGGDARLGQAASTVPPLVFPPPTTRTHPSLHRRPSRAITPSPPQQGLEAPQTITMLPTDSVTPTALEAPGAMGNQSVLPSPTRMMMSGGAFPTTTTTTATTATTKDAQGPRLINAQRVENAATPVPVKPALSTSGALQASSLPYLEVITAMHQHHLQTSADGSTTKTTSTAMASTSMTTTTTVPATPAGKRPSLTKSTVSPPSALDLMVDKVACNTVVVPPKSTPAASSSALMTYSTWSFSGGDSRHESFLWCQRAFGVAGSGTDTTPSTPTSAGVDAVRKGVHAMSIHGAGAGAGLGATTAPSPPPPVAPADATPTWRATPVPQAAITSPSPPPPPPPTPLPSAAPAQRQRPAHLHFKKLLKPRSPPSRTLSASPPYEQRRRGLRRSGAPRAAPPVRGPRPVSKRARTAMSQVRQQQQQEAVEEEGDNEKRKTEMCRYWSNGGCPKPASACDFAHGMADMRILTLQEKERLHMIPSAATYRTEVCRFWLSDRGCHWGARCTFAHRYDALPNTYNEAAAPSAAATSPRGAAKQAGKKRPTRGRGRGAGRRRRR